MVYYYERQTAVMGMEDGMEGHKEKEDIGEWVRDVVERATESMEFEQLNQAIRDTVNAAIHEVKTQTDGWRSRLGRPEEKRI